MCCNKDKKIIIQIDKKINEHDSLNYTETAWKDTVVKCKHVLSLLTKLELSLFSIITSLFPSVVGQDVVF